MNIGKTISDFYCNGFFGRRYDLEQARIEAEGHDWVVARLPSGEPVFADFYGRDDKQKLINDWISHVSD